MFKYFSSFEIFLLFTVTWSKINFVGEFYTSMNQLKNGPGPDNEHKCIKPITYVS